MALATFSLYSPEEFIAYILQTNFSRKIGYIQNHHTWKPSYADLKNGRDEMYWLESMRQVHIKDRKWSDIGQNITTFPSGKIALCRPIDSKPAGIYGANTAAVCIEHFGNFDSGADTMTPEHIDAILKVNAVLCRKFGLKPVPAQVVYHHWYDTSGKHFSDAQVNSGYVLRNKLQKTCPGTNFFKDPSDSFAGNTISAASKNFYPLIEKELAAMVGNVLPATAITQKRVNAEMLNVRSGRGTAFGSIKKLGKGTLVTVYEEKDDWSRINANSQEWVSSHYLS